MLKKLEGWKKIIATVITILVPIIGLWLNLEPDVIKTIVTALLVYIGAQSVADHGKEAAKVKSKQALEATK